MTEIEFNNLADKWRNDTAVHSMWYAIRDHENYSKFIESGTEIIPFILRRMENGDKSISLSLLLQEITGELLDYRPEIEGGFAKFKVVEFADSWIDWGRRNSYIE